jgi:hypothetical protein
MDTYTLDDYGVALKRKYDLVKKEDVSGLLSNPTPANLKKMCCNLIEIRTSKKDQDVFKNFFNLNQEENRVKQIEKVDTDRLRPVQYFLNGKTESPQQVVLDLIAVLIDFKPRPFLNFFRNRDESETEIEQEEIEIVRDKVKEGKSIEINRRSKATIIVGLLGLTIAGYVTKKEFFPAKECMQWNTNHYEEVVCEGNKIGFANINPIFERDEKLLDFKKIEVCDTTIFFKDNQPIIWYIKQNNECEYFNGPGLHPITNKPLRPITQYIIDKYVINKTTLAKD